MYIAFNSASNIQSQIMADDGFGQLGFFILALLYFFMGLGSLMSTAFIKLLGTKTCLFIGGLGNVQWIFFTIMAVEQKNRFDNDGLQLPPSKLITFFLCLSTMLNGFTLGILWACANNFVAQCASEENRGFFFSYFWTFYMTS